MLPVPPQDERGTGPQFCMFRSGRPSAQQAVAGRILRSAGLQLGYNPGLLVRECAERGSELGGSNDAPDSIGSGSASLRTGRGLVRLRGRRRVLADRTRRAAAIGHRRCVLRRAGGARPADLPGPMRGMSRQGDGRHQRTAAGRRRVSSRTGARVRWRISSTRFRRRCPSTCPASLSRQQSTDLTAYILQAGKFAAGQAELSDATLAQITFPAARTSPRARRRPPRGASLCLRRKETLPS